MGRKRNPERDQSMRRYIESGGKMTLDELAAAAGVPKARISKWKSEDKWEEKLKEAPKKRGGQPGNKNAGGRTPICTNLLVKNRELCHNKIQGVIYYGHKYRRINKTFTRRIPAGML